MIASRPDRPLREGQSLGLERLLEVRLAARRVWVFFASFCDFLEPLAALAASFFVDLPFKATGLMAALLAVAFLAAFLAVTFLASAFFATPATFACA
jgi:hypothetical protein